MSIEATIEPLPSVAAIHIPEGMSLTVFVKANAIDDWGNSPRWASFSIDNVWLARLQICAIVVRDNNFALAEVDDGPAWDDEDIHRLCGNRLVITADSFWFTAYPKHTTYDVETVEISFRSFIKAVNEAVTHRRQIIFFGLTRDDINVIETMSTGLTEAV